MYSLPELFSLIYNIVRIVLAALGEMKFILMEGREITALIRDFSTQFAVERHSFLTPIGNHLQSLEGRNPEITDIIRKKRD